MPEKSIPSISGKVVIVTGASSGIGEATAREFARAGARVVLAARRIERLERLAEEITASGGEALAVRTDITDITQVTNLVQRTLDAYGRIDVLANIAGWGRYNWLEELTAENLRNQYEVNVLGMAELTRQVLPVMKSQRSGHIINMSSYASKIASPPLTVYASTKYAVEGLSDGLRRELIPWGIHVTRVHPSGVTGTEFNKQAEREGGIHFRSFPIGKVSREQVARLLVRLVERPRRAVFLSRLYDVPAILNQLFPELVDWASAWWVRRMQRKEGKARALMPVSATRYTGALSLLKVAALALGAVTLAKAINRSLRRIR
ncbi:MAG: SDR family NAD(P)-dependent oxidoreductase [Chloroflexota bacterium]|nr:MAG: SDR family NAD(P)-dependent oxidoreductase [Chloroflexota bacterium]